MKLLIPILFLFASNVEARECEAGAMAKLLRAVEVSRVRNNEMERFTVAAGSDVHIIAVESGRFEIYVMRDSHGKLISASGEVPTGDVKILVCN
ncbi:MAG: hypothetical protein A4S09_08880 [Proteobacteria bacterium SG_bin7]|nr:MAG: hypothetical protein A4S09_08880 [Proteobacteria bacterium SG_bin7]